MNYKNELSKYEELLKEVEIETEDRDYTKDEVSRDIEKIVDYAMSGSSKDSSITNRLAKFDPVISIMNNYIK